MVASAHVSCVISALRMCKIPTCDIHAYIDVHNYYNTKGVKKSLEQDLQPNYMHRYNTKPAPCKAQIYSAMINIPLV